jgi:hypothetical protein|tara:strand:+ start:9734 stop:10279 length:546 start_codon:yes stop_codon:yes gene_type:complete
MADDWGTIIDPETDTLGTSKQEYSYEVLVMLSMKKCLEAGSNEMMEGYFNEKTDRQGNIVRTYVQDTRHKFIRCVKMLLSTMKTIFDEDAKKDVEKILEDLDKKYEELCNEELKEFHNAPATIKKQRMINGINHRKNNLNKSLPFYQDYIQEEVDAYTKLYSVLHSLASREGLGEEAVMHA